ncbi:MAG: ribbon-helix-helix domain-containing protein [Pseudomonadota bacterium]|nr:ribbon-helix-helix domain-containing protein [Pseudomonadota bacterium]
MSNQIKKTIVLSGHNTSIALEKEFWVQLKKIASKENLKLDDLIQKIDKEDRKGSLASEIRVYILKS